MSNRAKEANSCYELLKMYPQAFQADEAGDMEAVYQFEISGSEEFTVNITIADGQAAFADGPAEKPNVTVKSPADVWLAISRGEMNGQMAFMSGKFKASGDLGLLLKLNKVFRD